MKEAIANAGVFNLIIVFVTILLLLFIGSLSYTKAYKVKDRIVREIEKNKVYDEDVKTYLEDWLSDVGYRYSGSAFSCPSTDNSGGTSVAITSVYDYCVYDHTVKSSDGVTGHYYSVVSYMYIELPIIKDVFRIPVHGETNTIINTIEG